ncbi:YfhO family protein, partial [Candidatus Gottesmanbacteria bacterium]|nr:YfhO family protein [Candidatus Gottesmanbacteria bacterium]
RHLILVVFGLSGLIGLGLQRFNKPFSFLIALFISAEMILYARHFIVLKPIPETRHDAELITLLKQDKEPYRVLTNFGAWIPPRDSFDFDAGANYRVFNATGYDPSILRSYYEFIDIANGNAPGASILAHDVQVPYLNVFSPATDFLNIKYILVPRAYDPLAGASGQASSRFRLIREDVSRDYRLYENKNVKPRFYIENGSAAIEKYSPNEIVLTTDVPKDATMVSSEVFYPGWEGFVDGKKVDVIKTNNAFRALFVPAGRHTVTYRYSPRIFLVGGVVSLASLGIACYIFFRSMSSTQSNKNS